MSAPRSGPEILSRYSGSSFPAHAMRAADLARGALDLVPKDTPAAVAMAELVRRIDAGDLVDRCEVQRFIDDEVEKQVDDARDAWAEMDRYDPNR